MGKHVGELESYLALVVSIIYSLLYPSVDVISLSTQRGRYSSSSHVACPWIISLIRCAFLVLRSNFGHCENVPPSNNI